MVDVFKLLLLSAQFGHEVSQTHILQIDHESHIEFVKLQVVSFPFPSRCSLWSLSLLSQTLPPKRKAIFKHNLELIKQRNANQVLVRNSPL